VLVFLLGIVTRSLDAKEDKAMCVAALRHAASFLAAQPNIDFQTILPSLFVAIWGEDIDIRYAATDCIAVVASNHEDLHAVYGFDTIYGDKSGTCRIYPSLLRLSTHLCSFPGNLKYLDAADVLNYVKNIINSKDLFAQDANYFRIFHHQHLARKTSDSKVDAKSVELLFSRPCPHINAPLSDTNNGFYRISFRISSPSACQVPRLPS
jgi:U3 small nucleolar RNA-associated protein 10